MYQFRSLASSRFNFGALADFGFSSLTEYRLLKYSLTTVRISLVSIVLFLILLIWVLSLSQLGHGSGNLAFLKNQLLVSLTLCIVAWFLSHWFLFWFQFPLAIGCIGFGMVLFSKFLSCILRHLIVFFF